MQSRQAHLRLHVVSHVYEDLRFCLRCQGTVAHSHSSPMYRVLGEEGLKSTGRIWALYATQHQRLTHMFLMNDLR